MTVKTLSLKNFIIVLFLFTGNLTYAQDQLPTDEELSKISLFKDYNYMTKKSDILRSHSEAKNCNDPLVSDSLCLDGFDFLEFKWQIIFVFEDEKLFRVVLISNYSETIEQNVSNALIKSFVSILITSGENQFDVASKFPNDASEEEKFLIEFQEFMAKAKEKGKYSYLLVDKELATPLLRIEKSALNIIQKIPINTRILSLEIDSLKDNWLRLVFEIPKADIVRRSRSTPIEKF